mmetsp:Transcript_40768/g.112117  ORF Transcript_40768/g.112117 Transcript_40768/m.112117 type:complete len:87 (-) Transcript_40768:227-487(-)
MAADAAGCGGVAAARSHAVEDAQPAAAADEPQVQVKEDTHAPPAASSGAPRSHRARRLKTSERRREARAREWAQGREGAAAPPSES